MLLGLRGWVQPRPKSISWHCGGSYSSLWGPPPRHRPGLGVPAHPFGACGAAGLTGEEAAVPEMMPPLGLLVGGQQAFPRMPCENCGLSLYKCLQVSVSGGDRGARVLHPTTGNHMPLKTVVDERRTKSSLADGMCII